MERFSSFFLSYILFSILSASSLIFATDSSSHEIKTMLLHGNFKAAAKQLQRLSENADPYAKYQLAMLYLNGRGVKRSYTRAEKLLTVAATRNSDAAYLLGSLYMKGNQLNKNEKLAVYFLNLATVNGNSKAPLLLKKLKNTTQSNITNLQSSAMKNSLTKAIETGELAKIKSLVAQGLDLNVVLLNGDSALIYATRLNQLNLVQWLVEQDTNLDQTNSAGNTALQEATNNQSLELIKILSTRFSNINNANQKNKTALMIAIDNNFYTGINFLINKGANIPKSYKDNLYKNKQINYQIQSLRKLSQDTNSSFYQWPIVAIAVAQNQPSTATKLIENQQSPWKFYKATSSSNKNVINNAINIAIRKNYKDLIQRMLTLYPLAKQSAPNLVTSFYNAAIDSENLHLMQLATKRAKQLNIKTIHQQGLNIAILNGKSIALGYILKDKSIELDPLLLTQALSNNSPKIALSLLEAGIPLYKKDDKGSTPLIKAIQLDDLNLVQHILRRTVEVDARDQKQLTALMWASKLGCIDCTRLLLSKGANAQLTSESGNTALMYASQGQPKIILMLIRLDLDLSIRNKLSYTSLMLAIQSNCAACVKILLNNDANPRRKTNTGQDSFDLAMNKPNIFALLNR